MTKKIADMDDVKARIKQLEEIQAHQMDDIKGSFRAMGETLSPTNLIKGALKSVVSSPGLRSTVLDTAISAGAGLLGRKIVVRGSHGILRKVAGTAVQFFLTNFVRNKMPKIKENITPHPNGVAH